LAGTYAIWSTTGFTKAVPVGPNSKGVPFTTRGSLAKALETATDRLMLAARASGGTTILTAPDSTFSVPPLLEITPPSSTVIVDVPLFPSTVAVIVAAPAATPATIPEVETVAFAGSEVLQTKLRCSCSPEAALAVAES
jgi:hypothetical protein